MLQASSRTLFAIIALQAIALAIMEGILTSRIWPFLVVRVPMSWRSVSGVFEELPPGYKSAHEKEARNWIRNVSTDPFYQSPIGWESLAPGSVLRIEKIGKGEYEIPPGHSIRRILYVSSDLDKKPVPASAFILLPTFAHSPNAALKVVVWAHGTAGLERQCAPSNQRDLYYDYEGPYSMVLRGYAVLAPDYAGLGSDTPFHYLAGPSHASDIAYAVMAARQAFPTGILTNEWVVIGHSEGGLAAWAINEREVVSPIGGFKGSVAIGPALQNLHILRYGLAHGSDVLPLHYASYTLSTIARLDPTIDVKDYFSDLGLKRTHLAMTGCFFSAMAIFDKSTFRDMFKDVSWIESSWALAWENRTAIIGDKPLAAPLLLIEGLGETSVFPATTEAVVKKHCGIFPDSPLHVSRYPDMDHEDIPFCSQAEVFGWIEERFNDIQVPTGCTSETVPLIQYD